MNTTRIVEYTQNKVDNWYKNARIDSGVYGGAVVSETSDTIQINYLENDKSGCFSVPKTMLAEEKIDYLYNNWAEA